MIKRLYSRVVVRWRSNPGCGAVVIGECSGGHCEEGMYILWFVENWAECLFSVIDGSSGSPVEMLWMCNCFDLHRGVQVVLGRFHNVSKPVSQDAFDVRIVMDLWRSREGLTIDFHMVGAVIETIQALSAVQYGSIWCWGSSVRKDLVNLQANPVMLDSVSHILLVCFVAFNSRHWNRDPIVVQACGRTTGLSVFLRHEEQASGSSYM